MDLGNRLGVYGQPSGSVRLYANTVVLWAEY